MDYLGFVITSNFLKNPQSRNDMAFHRIFSFCGNFNIGNLLHQLKISKIVKNLGNLCFPILFCAM